LWLAGEPFLAPVLGIGPRPRALRLGS
jgi:hypothetical protein